MTPEQDRAMRIAHLKRGNEIRAWRAHLKREIATGATTIAAVLRADDDRLATMQVRALLMAVPGLGRVKAHRALIANNMGPSTRIRTLPQSRREELVSWLAANHPALRERIA